MDIKKYIYGHCVSPVRVKMWDAYSSSYVYNYVPCGKCLHCKNTHINEWVTRLFAQRKYSKYCYYVSLDYAPFTISDPVSYQLAKETAACYHNINIHHKFGMHPLVLCKNHLQDFYKRLRKNTGIKLQYFACGEYGMHANGTGFGRPHFHNIIFSNDPISNIDFISAWSIKGYHIGRVDIQDLNVINVQDSDNLKIFKYVCKYLQKADFDFENLATISFHRSYFKCLNLALKQTDLFSFKFDSVENTAEETISWKQYIKLYSPFVVCSRRPSIGSAYFEENLERFKDQDFRLFGLPQICTTFPRYYLRRTKESLCPFRCVGEISQKPSSSSRLDYINKVLHYLLDLQRNVDNWTETPVSPWCVCFKNGVRVVSLGDDRYVRVSDLHLYDAQNKLFYQFDGYFYKVWCKLKGCYSLLDVMDISQVLSETVPSWDNYYHFFVKPCHDKHVLLEKELNQLISALYKDDHEKSSYDRFLDDVYNIYQSELATQYKTKLLMQNSKITL